MEVVCLAFSP